MDKKEFYILHLRGEAGENRFEMRKMRKQIKFLASIVFIFMILACPMNTGSVSAIGKITSGDAISDIIRIIIKPEVKIIYNGEEQVFRESTGQILYPIVYNDIPYLPVRPISQLYGEEIEWDRSNSTMYISKALGNSDIVKNKVPIIKDHNQKIELKEKITSYTTTAYLRPNFAIVKDFKEKAFYDKEGAKIPPIVLNGYTYLPVDEISDLMGDTIIWYDMSKTVVIGSKNQLSLEQEKSDVTILLVKQFEKQLQLYENATEKIQTIRKMEKAEDLRILLNEISKDYAIATKNTAYLKSISYSDYSEKEEEAYHSLLEFAEASERYILVLENIAYMAANDQDFPIMAETFLSVAVESQNKMDKTRNLLQVLEVAK